MSKPLTPSHDTDPDTRIATLANGVRVLTITLPHLASASVSVFVRSGSRNESRAQAGVSHFAEHMAFKGTATRNCQQINLDAERLGADVNAHTDKDHTAYHMRGLAEHAPDFVRMLGDIVCHGSYPEAEFERERQVILQELTETEDDAFDTAFQLFDRMCYGTHPLAQPVIGRRASIERLTRTQLQAYVQRQYTGANLIVAAAGRVDPDEIVRVAEQAFGAMPVGEPNRIEAPPFAGGLGVKRVAGVGQTHLVLGFPALALTAPGHAAHTLAATLFGEGMSSPLMDEIRERRGLVYYAACSADLDDLVGQFVIEASMAPEHVEACVDEVARLLRQQAERLDPLHVERARNQIAVRRLQTLERPGRRLEQAALDLFSLGRVRSAAERRDEVAAIGTRRLRAVFEGLLDAPVAIGAAGRVRDAARARLQALAEGLGEA
ncbi:MAG TPA: pitrilysin family protein [Ideonella sp.]|nr:pitrilysin family protein [Ideonella sp.]